MTADTLRFQVQQRSIKKKRVRQLREAQMIPGVIYGRGMKSTSIQVDARIFSKIYAQAGRGALIELSVDDQAPVKVMIHDVAKHYLSCEIQHVDFYAVDMNKTVTTTVTLHFTGEAPAAKLLGGTVVKNKDHVTIQCLPSQLIKELFVPLEKLSTFDDVIRIHDILLPSGITVTDRGDDIIVAVAPPRSDEELAALDQAVTEDVSKVETVKKVEKEEAEAETSATPAEESKKEAEATK